MPIVHDFVKRLLGNRSRVVELALGLLDDDLEFACEFLAIDRGMHQRVALDRNGVLQAGTGQHREVTGVVVAGTRVEVPARGLGLPRDLSRPAGRRSLEEHVLEHVRDPHPAIGLVEETGFHMRDNRRDRRGAVALHQQRETVGEDFPPDIG